jgi:hypothetical protein
VGAEDVLPRPLDFLRAEGLLAKMGEPVDPIFLEEKDLSEAKVNVEGREGPRKGPREGGSDSPCLSSPPPQLEEVRVKGLMVDQACEERQRMVVQLVLDCQVGREGGREVDGLYGMVRIRVGGGEGGLLAGVWEEKTVEGGMNLHSE